MELLFLWESLHDMPITTRRLDVDNPGMLMGNVVLAECPVLAVM
jgi:hypothetical protein